MRYKFEVELKTLTRKPSNKELNKLTDLIQEFFESSGMYQSALDRDISLQEQNNA